MIPLIVGAGLMAGGTAANLYGTYQRDKAQKAAMKAYQNAMNKRASQEQAALGEEAGVLSGLARERQGGIGSYLQGLQMSERENPQDTQQFRANNAGALTDIGKMTGGAQSSYAYQGAPRSGAEGQQGDISKQSNSRLAEAMLADHQLRAITERQTNAAHQMTFADLMRQGRGKTQQERFQLAKALRDLDWQKKTAALQGQLDDAGRKGQWANILGGLGTQIGGMTMMAGMGGGAEGAAGSALPGAAEAGTTNALAAGYAPPPGMELGASTAGYGFRF